MGRLFDVSRPRCFLSESQIPCWHLLRVVLTHRIVGDLRHTVKSKPNVRGTAKWNPHPREQGMTLEHEPRIRELIRLIVDERDPERLKILATELECLLIISGGAAPIVYQKPRSS